MMILTRIAKISIDHAGNCYYNEEMIDEINYISG